MIGWWDDDTRLLAVCMVFAPAI